MIFKNFFHYRLTCLWLTSIAFRGGGPEVAEDDGRVADEDGASDSLISLKTPNLASI